MQIMVTKQQYETALNRIETAQNKAHNTISKNDALKAKLTEAKRKIERIRADKIEIQKRADENYDSLQQALVAVQIEKLKLKELAQSKTNVKAVAFDMLVKAMS